MAESETFLAAADRDRYIQVDITDWAVLRREQLGTKPKRWIIDANVVSVSHPRRTVSS
jgi:hypothetical protein